MSRVCFILTAIVLALLGTAAPTAVHAQSPSELLPQRSISLQIGTFTYEIPDETFFPLVAVRANWRLSKYFLAEAGVSYAPVEVQNVIRTTPPPEFIQVTSHTGAVTVGVQAQLPLEYLRPYVGAAMGIFVRVDPPGGRRYVQTTQALAAGLRIPITDDIGMRADFRLRFDTHQTGLYISNVKTIGLSWHY